MDPISRELDKIRELVDRIGEDICGNGDALLPMTVDPRDGIYRCVLRSSIRARRLLEIAREGSMILAHESLPPALGDDPFG